MSNQEQWGGGALIDNVRVERTIAAAGAAAAL